MATGARPGNPEKFKRWTSNLSPALYEAKIDLEEYKAKYFVKKADKNGFLFFVLANPEAENAEEIENCYERLFDVYNQIAMRDAKANGVCAMVVMRYMDEAYEEALEDHQQPDINVAVLMNAR